MKELQIFEHEDFGQIRVVELDGEPWLVGKDVALGLKYENPTKAIRDHVMAEDKIMGVQNVSPSITDTMGRLQYPTWINESGLYSLILSSKLPGAKRFKRWVTHEVLPALRKTGQYSLHPVTEQRGLTIDDYLKAASIVANCRNERLPYVLGFLEQGGLSVPKIQEMSAGKLVLADGRHTRYAKTDEDVNAQAAACAIINEAVERYGFSLAQIGRITGIHSGRICNYKKGKRPTPDRARYIVDVLTRYLPQEDQGGA